MGNLFTHTSDLHQDSLLSISLKTTLTLINSMSSILTSQVDIRGQTAPWRVTSISAITSVSVLSSQMDDYDAWTTSWGWFRNGNSKQFLLFPLPDDPSCHPTVIYPYPQAIHKHDFS